MEAGLIYRVSSRLTPKGLQTCIAGRIEIPWRPGRTNFVRPVQQSLSDTANGNRHLLLALRLAMESLPALAEVVKRGAPGIGPGAAGRGSAVKRGKEDIGD